MDGFFHIDPTRKLIERLPYLFFYFFLFFSEQRKVVAAEMMRYFDMSEVEQRIRLSGQVPTVEAYQEMRMGTSAVGVTLSLLE